MEKIEIEKMLQHLGEQKGIAVHVAEEQGKNPTNTGPIAQARHDGYRCAIRDAIKALNSL